MGQYTNRQNHDGVIRNKTIFLAKIIILDNDTYISIHVFFLLEGNNDIQHDMHEIYESSKSIPRCFVPRTILSQNYEKGKPPAGVSWLMPYT